MHPSSSLPSAREAIHRCDHGVNAGKPGLTFVAALLAMTDSVAESMALIGRLFVIFFAFLAAVPGGRE